MPDVTNGIFSDLCHDQMWELYRTPHDEVGSKFRGNRAGRSITNCIIYVSNVLIYAHEKIGYSWRNERIDQLGRKDQNGTELAKYLVGQAGWKAHYWNPDVSDKSRDGSAEHSASYRDMVAAKKSYYNIPISGTIINYNKVNKESKTVWTSVPVITGPPVFGRVPQINVPIPVTASADNLKILDKFSKVKFAFGIARGGFHTFLVSYGVVFEVHWAEEGGKLYGRVNFKDYEWLSGAMIIPPDSSFTSDEI